MANPKISNRVLKAPASPIRKLMVYANQAKEKGVSIYHLNIGQPDIHTPEVMYEAANKFEHKTLAYGPSEGLPEYRDALVKYYNDFGLNITRDDVYVTIAGSEAIVFAMLATMDPGEEIIIPEPFYANYNGFAVMSDVNIKPLTSHPENGFALPSKEEIEKVITEKTRAILLCNPNNPTGRVYTKEEVEMVAELAQEHNLFVIADEVYREFIYGDVKHTSILSVEGMEERGIIIDSISKRYSACGSRIGCIVCKNRELMQNILKFAQARLCPPTLDQHMAIATINLDESYFEEINVEYQKRRDIVFEELQKIEGVLVKKPDGAFYMVVKLPVEDAEDFVKWMLTDFSVNNETVMVAPAAGFYATPGLGLNEIRIAYILNEEKLRKAMNIFAEGLKKYKELKK